MAIAVVDAVAAGIDAQVVVEGAEPPAFWQALNGQTDYDRSVNAPGAPLLAPRLFHCKLLASGRLRVEEIGSFKQNDLDEDDIMVLDTGDEVYVWEGNRSEPEEKQKAIDMVYVSDLGWHSAAVALLLYRFTFMVS